MVAALAVAVPVAASIYFGSRPGTAEERVAACEEKHNAPSMRDLPGGGEAYGHCSWPRIRGAAKDGFYEIKVRSFDIPGATNIESYTHVAVFETGCRRLRLQYQFAHMVAIPTAQPPVVVDNEGTISFEGEPLDPDEEGLAYPVPANTPGELAVYESARYPLKSVQCVTATS